ncbi:MAG: energy transducer TonB [Saprospiraceae bacterium]|nr:energy transducer TonB [Pyrinomonadaceae bacterium]
MSCAFSRLKAELQTFFVFIPCLFALIFSGQAAAQRLAVIVPEKTPPNEKFVEILAESLASKLIVLDDSLSETAFRSADVKDAFNMTATEAKRVAAAIGCDYFLIVRTGALRRSSFAKPEYYEAFNVVYLVSARTGRLAFWDLRSFEAGTAADAEKLLLRSAESLASDIAGKIGTITKNDMSEKLAGSIEQVPEIDAQSKTFRPPLPYKRIKPEYTRIAYLYDARATVDISVDIDENGVILRTEIVRWAGFGLDKAVIDAVGKMNWRPAERSGKTLPMRVLLRYNFTKIEKE